MKLTWTDLPLAIVMVILVPVLFLGIGFLAGLVVAGFEFGRGISG